MGIPILTKEEGLVREQMTCHLRHGVDIYIHIIHPTPHRKSDSRELNLVAVHFSKMTTDICIYLRLQEHW